MNRCRGFDAFPFPISRLIFYINYYRQVTWQDSISRRDALYCVQYDAYYLFGEMKLLHIICFWLSVSLGLLIFIQIPIIKLSTPSAVKLIEDHCLRKDLTDQDTAKYQWAKRCLIAFHAAGHPPLPGLGQRLLQLLIHRLSSALRLPLNALQFLLVMDFRPFLRRVVEPPRLPECAGDGGGDRRGQAAGEGTEHQNDDQAPKHAQARLPVTVRIKTRLPEHEWNLAKRKHHPDGQVLEHPQQQEPPEPVHVAPGLAEQFAELRQH